MGMSLARCDFQAAIRSLARRILSRLTTRPVWPSLPISAFETDGTGGKQISRNIDDAGAYENIRLRIDSNPAFAT